MSKEYEGQDPLVLAKRAEQDLNTYQKSQGLGDSKTGDSAADSGIDTSATSRFPGSEVKIGSAATGREIPPDEGGDVLTKPGQSTGRRTKDTDFEGEGGPETKQQLYEADNPGNDDVEANVRQVKKPEGETVPTKFGVGIVGKDM